MSGFDREKAEGKRWGKKQKADCRADTRGGSWAGIPKCLIDSPAYRDLSLHARAVLVEIVARMNGYNNGEIAVSRRELVAALGCTPRYIGFAITELVEHGMIDVPFEGQWKARQSRQYRLTFVSTKSDRPATNDYLRWTPSSEKSSGSHAEPEQGQSGSHAEPGPFNAGSHAEPRIVDYLRKTAKSESPSGSAWEPLISKPCPPAQMGRAEGDNGSLLIPLRAAGLERASETASITDQGGAGNGTVQHIGCRTCEDCGSEFELDRPDRAKPRRFCSEACRKRAEGRRAYERRKHQSEPTPIGSILNGVAQRIVAGGSA